MYATHHPCWDAKNRFGLPDEMDLDYSHIAHLFTGQAPVPAPPAQPDFLAELAERMERDAVTEAQIRQVVAQKGHYPEEVSPAQYHPDFFRQWLFPHWEKIVDVIRSSPEYTPF